eukprot:3495576-Pleurochrysis_carterae.AAC.1
MPREERRRPPQRRAVQLPPAREPRVPRQAPHGHTSLRVLAISHTPPGAHGCMVSCPSTTVMGTLSAASPRPLRAPAAPPPPGRRTASTPPPRPRTTPAGTAQRPWQCRPPVAPHLPPLAAPCPATSPPPVHRRREAAAYVRLARSAS